MLVYGRYDGNLVIILKQNRFGKFVLDVYNSGYNKVRFITDIDQSNLPKEFLREGTAEDWIDALLDNVVEGYYKKYYFIPFTAKKVEDRICKSMAKLTKEKYKSSEGIWR